MFDLHTGAIAGRPGAHRIHWSRPFSDLALLREVHDALDSPSTTPRATASIIRFTHLGGLKWHSLLIASISGGLAVMLGAFGAHGLADSVTPARLQVWRTAAHYHLIHSVVLLGICYFDASTFKAPRTRSMALHRWHRHLWCDALRTGPHRHCGPRSHHASRWSLSYLRMVSLRLVRSNRV